MKTTSGYYALPWGTAANKINYLDDVFATVATAIGDSFLERFERPWRGFAFFFSSEGGRLVSRSATVAKIESTRRLALDVARATPITPHNNGCSRPMLPVLLEVQR